MNEHLMQTKDNDVTTPVTINLQGFDFADDSLSGLVPDGRYKVVINSAKWRFKKQREGRNLRVVMTICGPEKYAGTTIVENHPAPIGDMSDPATAFGYKRLSALFASVLEGVGRLEEFKVAGEVQFKPEQLQGKYAHAETRKTLNQNGNEVSQIARYMAAQEYMDAPGPSTQETVSAPVVPSKPTTELFPAQPVQAAQPAVMPVMPAQPVTSATPQPPIAHNPHQAAMEALLRQHQQAMPQQAMPQQIRPDNGTTPAPTPAQPPNNPLSLTGL